MYRGLVGDTLQRRSTTAPVVLTFVISTLPEFLLDRGVTSTYLNSGRSTVRLPPHPEPPSSPKDVSISLRVTTLGPVQ